MLPLGGTARSAKGAPLNRGAGAASRTQAQRALLFMVVGVLVLVLAGVAYVQWRQYRLLESSCQPAGRKSCGFIRPPASRPNG